jgi:hypothetical protein
MLGPNRREMTDERVVLTSPLIPAFSISPNIDSVTVRHCPEVQGLGSSKF